MEHNVYEKVQEYLALLSKIELLTCTVVHNSFKKVRDQAQQVSIKHGIEIFYFISYCLLLCLPYFTKYS